MSYTIITRSLRFHSLSFTNKNIFCRTASPLVLYTNNTKKRNFSLQASVETTIKTQSGIFRFISESAPVEYLQNFVVNLHDSSGLPWWATIVCTTVLLRSFITAPLAIYQHIIIGRLYNLNKELMILSTELKKEVAAAVHMYNWDQKLARFHYNRSLKKQWNILVIRENCHPVKTAILIIFQIPLWVCYSVTVRNLVYMLPTPDTKAHLIYSQLSVEGFSWITNLTQLDHLCILPVTLGLVNLAIIEMQALSRISEPSRLQRYIINVFRGFSILMVPLAACVPVGVTLYWTTSSVYGLVQNLVLMSPKVKRFCRIPQTSIEVEKPYRHMYNNLKQKTKFIFDTLQIK